MSQFLQTGLQFQEVLEAVALRELVQRICVGHLSVLITPGELVGLDVVSPHMHLAGLQDECQTTVSEGVGLVQPVTLHTVTDRIDEHDQQQQGSGSRGVIDPFRCFLLQVLGIEPFVLQRLQFFGDIEFGQFLVEYVEQMLVVRHELILTVGHIHGGQLEVVDQVAVHEPFQRQGVPHDLTFLTGTHLLDHLSDIFSGDGVVAPAVVKHQVVAHRVTVDDDLHTGLAQVAEGLDLYGFRFRRDHTLGEQRHSILTIETILVVITHGQSQGQVALATFQVVEGLLCRLQFDDVGNVESIHHQPYQVNIISLWFSVVVEERVRPQIPYVLIYQRMSLCVLTVVRLRRGSIVGLCHQVAAIQR